MSLPPVVCRRAHVLNLCYFCLFTYSAQWTGIQYILCCVFVLFIFVLCILCFHFLWIIHFLLPFRYSLTFILYISFLTIIILSFTQVMPKCQYEYRNPVMTGNSYMCLSIRLDLNIWISCFLVFAKLAIQLIINESVENVWPVVIDYKNHLSCYVNYISR